MKENKIIEEKKGHMTEKWRKSLNEKRKEEKREERREIKKENEWLKWRKNGRWREVESD